MTTQPSLTDPPDDDSKPDFRDPGYQAELAAKKFRAGIEAAREALRAAMGGKR